MKKTEEDLKEEQRSEAEKRAKLELVLKEIFKAEKMEIDQEQVKNQVESIKKMHPQAEEQNIKLYVENILVNEKVMKFLEEQAEK